MKKNILPLFFCLILLFVSACSSGNRAVEVESPKPTVVPRSEAVPALPEGSVVFEVSNMIGGDIYEMYISPNSLDTFGADILGDSILPQGGKKSVSFVPEDTYSYWDLRVLTENGNIYTWQNIKFGTFSEITLTIGENGPEFSVI